MAHPIAAIATGLVRSGIGILRMSGDGCIDLANRVFALYNGQALSSLPDRKLARGTLFDAQGRPIDEAMVFVSHAPHSYTGEDTVEFQCHGSPAVLTAGLSALLSNGFHQAGPGEFTKRAFLNGQMDLTQAEAVIDLIDAETADAAANAAGQVAGVLRKQLDPIYDSLMDICSHFHAVLDYPDEDIEPLEQREIADTLSRCRRQLQRLLDTFHRGRILREGIPTVLLGLPNAGKSSLLNALLGYDRAIVTEVAGTTRDTVEEKVRLGGQMLRLCDTAGIRDARDSVERIGVDRAVAAAERASLSLVVLDGSVPLTGTEERIFALAQQAEHSLLLVNKSDLPRQAELAGLADRFDGVCSVCARTGEGVEQIGRLVQALYPQAVRTDGALLTNTRQAEAVGRALAAVDRAQGALSAALTPDAILTDAEEALAALGELTGKSIREDLVATIFSRFCVGK